MMASMAADLKKLRPGVFLCLSFAPAGFVGFGFVIVLVSFRFGSAFCIRRPVFGW
jgi:hypothetical protein